MTKIKKDKIIKSLFLIISTFSASVIVIIIFFIAIKGVKPFIYDYQDSTRANIFTFLFTFKYYKGSYGVLGIVINTFFITFLSVLIAAPISILSSLLIVRTKITPLKKVLICVVELLSSIPSIIYGLFGMGKINPLIRDIASIFNLQTAGGASLLSAVIILAMMIIPTISLLSINAMEAVPKKLIDASLALGATPTETNFKIVVGGAKKGIIAGIILGVGRAIGEATAVSMVSGGSIGLALLIFSPTSTLTSVMLDGIYESTGLNYDIRFSTGIVLIIIIFLTNFILNKVKRKLCRYEA